MMNFDEGREPISPGARDASSRLQSRVITTERELAAIDAAWERLRGSLAHPTLEHRRGWLEIEARTQKGMMVVTLDAPGGDPQSIAPFLLRRWKLQCRLGYQSVVSFPMTLARLCGDVFLGPTDRARQEALFEAIAGAPVPYHTLFFEGLGVDSPLRKLIDESPVVRDNFAVYCPTPPAKHWLIRLPKTFAEYDASLGKKRRGQFKAGERKLSAACGSPVKIQRVTSVDDLPFYFESVARLSKVSWQGQKLGQVVEPGSPAAKRMEELARKNWFRGYLLRSETEVIAFVIGFQSDGVYDYHKIGYDPKWAAYSPGNVMLYRLIEDLCTHDPAHVIDLGGGDSQYKRVFGNDSFDEQNVYLMRKSTYTRVARATHGAFTAVTTATRKGLERTGLLERARRVLRRGVAAAPSATPAAEPKTEREEGAA